MTPAAAIEALKAGRKMLTLLVVASAAAGLYVWGETARRDRDALIVWSDLTCTAAGSEFRPAETKKRQWGVACLAEVKRLAAVEEAVKTQNLEALLADLERREGKEAADAALAAVMSQRAADAVVRMEAADAAVEGDRVGSDWAAAVNELGGLRNNRR
ncbi:hypothetical protein [Brevundimonas sp. CEF1]|uniref:hypothetical protein n=1 Tax=Brevundimonas sp. CEF1 TaxID=3442642 RepID=UPI003F514DB0